MDACWCGACAWCWWLMKPWPRPVVLIVHVYTLHRSCGDSARTRQTNTQNYHTSLTTAHRAVSLPSPRCHRAKPVISIGYHFCSKQNGVHGLIPSSFGRVTCHYSTGLGPDHLPGSLTDTPNDVICPVSFASWSLSHNSICVYKRILFMLKCAKVTCTVSYVIGSCHMYLLWR